MSLATMYRSTGAEAPALNAGARTPPNLSRNAAKLLGSFRFDAQQVRARRSARSPPPPANANVQASPPSGVQSVINRV
jgi:hypothetical protein